MIVDPALLEEVNGARGKSGRHGQAQRGGRPRTGAFESIDNNDERKARQPERPRFDVRPDEVNTVVRANNR